MEEWTKWQETYTDDDESAFSDPMRANIHFGLPLPNSSRMFSISLLEDGRTNVHGAGKQFRNTYFGNTVAYRYISSLYPNAWIWDERYRFTLDENFSKDPGMLLAQQKFTEKVGRDRILELRRNAIRKGLNPDGKTEGRPDLAVYIPEQKPQWYFVEIKIPERKDKLADRQIRWLRLFSEYFGIESAVVLELRKIQTNP